jgi:hypothetical protein
MPEPLFRRRRASRWPAGLPAYGRAERGTSPGRTGAGRLAGRAGCHATLSGDAARAARVSVCFPRLFCRASRGVPVLPVLAIRRFVNFTPPRPVKLYKESK